MLGGCSTPGKDHWYLALKQKEKKNLRVRVRDRDRNRDKIVLYFNL